MEKGEVLHHADDLMIAIVGETVFAVYPPRRNAATYFSQKLWPNVIKQSPEIIEKMKMRRFMLPGDRLCFEDWDVFGPASATRYIIEEGKMRCPDTVIGTIPPPLPAEVEGILAAIDELKPVMTLDLHEGGSDGFFMFADSPTSDLEVSVAHAMSAAVSANGGKVTPPDEIIAYWIEHFGEAVPKMYTHIGASTWSKAWEGRTLGGYVRKYGGIIVPETGRELPLAKRIEMQICAALGAIEAVENQD
jgi:hypothetical protein